MEVLEAKKNPGKEAMHALDKKSPLDMYNCLIPSITERQYHRELAKQGLPAKKVADQEAFVNAMLNEKEIMKEKNLEAEVKVLHK